MTGADIAAQAFNWPGLALAGLFSLVAVAGIQHLAQEWRTHREKREPTGCPDEVEIEEAE